MPVSPPRHKAVTSIAAPRHQAEPAPRGPSVYNYRWQKLRAAFLAIHPLCQCGANAGAGCGYVASVVDHKTPHNGDAALIYAWDNLQAMTKPCHDRKTAARDGGFGNPRRPPSRPAPMG